MHASFLVRFSKNRPEIKHEFFADGAIKMGIIHPLHVDREGSEPQSKNATSIYITVLHYVNGIYIIFLY